MVIRAGSSHGPGRLEPFVLVSVVLHAAVLVLVAPALRVESYPIAMSEGGVVRVIPYVPPAPPGPSAPAATAKATTAVQRSSTTVVKPAQTPKPAPTPKPAAKPPAKAPGKPAVSPPQPAVNAQKPSGEGQASRELLTSERSPSQVPVAPEPTNAPATEQAAQEPATPTATGEAGTEEAEQPPLSPSVVEAGAAPPSYPKNAVTAGAEGRVVLSIVANPDGSVREVQVKEGSGNAALDSIAGRWVQSEWRMRPSPSGRPYQLDVAFEFRMPRDAQGRVQPEVTYRFVSERVTYL